MSRIPDELMVRLDKLISEYYSKYGIGRSGNYISVMLEERVPKNE